MGKDEQIEEREILDSIYPDEITDVSPTEYRVSIELEVTQPEEDDTPLRRSAIRCYDFYFLTAV